MGTAKIFKYIGGYIEIYIGKKNIHIFFWIYAWAEKIRKK